MWEHKAKSLIIGSLLGLGVIIMIVGNAMIDSASEGLKEGFIEFFTGNVMVSAGSDSAFSIFGADEMSFGEMEPTPSIPEYEQVYEHLMQDSRVAAVSGLVTTYGIFSADRDEDAFAEATQDETSMVFGVLFGVNFDNYFATFPSIKLKEGRIPLQGENAILLSSTLKEQLDKKYNKTFEPGDTLLITGIMGGMRIREVNFAGIYDRGDTETGTPFVITDVDTARVLAGLTLSSDENVVIAEEHASLLSSDLFDDNFDDMFGDMFDFGEVESSSTVASYTEFDSAASFLGDTSKRELFNTAASGAWHFLLVRLNHNYDTNAVIKDTGDWAANEGLDVRVADWKAAAGMAGRMADLIRLIFVIAIVVIAVVAIIIIMNTLVISVIERTGEIGTMRALGAKRSFIRIMFLTETLTQSLFFGFLGAIVAVSGLNIANAMKIPLENTFAKLLLGGDFVHLVPSMGIILGTIFTVFLVGFFAHLYPVSVALKIQPVTAMQTE